MTTCLQVLNPRTDMMSTSRLLNGNIDVGDGCCRRPMTTTFESPLHDPVAKFLDGSREIIIEVFPGELIDIRHC